MKSDMRTWVALAIAVLWGIGYIVAIVEREAGIAAAATPVALLAIGYLLGGGRLLRKGDDE